MIRAINTVVRPAKKKGLAKDVEKIFSDAAESTLNFSENCQRTSFSPISGEPSVAAVERFHTEIMHAEIQRAEHAKKEDDYLVNLVFPNDMQVSLFVLNEILPALKKWEVGSLNVWFHDDRVGTALFYSGAYGNPRALQVGELEAFLTDYLLAAEPQFVALQEALVALQQRLTTVFEGKDPNDRLADMAVQRYLALLQEK